MNKYLLLLSLIYFILLAFTNCDLDVKFNTTVVEINSQVLFQWNNANPYDVNAKIVFYKNDNEPSLKDHYVENCFAYLNPIDNFKKNKLKESGKKLIQAPSKEGLYKIFFCAESKSSGFYCKIGKPILVITCPFKDKKIEKNDEVVKNANSKIEHVIIIISENHSFDSIYGNYCKAEPFSNPTCNIGPECCERIPEELNGFKPKTLTDIQNSRYDPCHHSYCEDSEINGGKMDRYIIGGEGSNENNFAAANDDFWSAKLYFNWAYKYAMSDRFFQSSPGASSQNDMYFATGKFMFKDNEIAPQRKSLNGNQCINYKFKSYFDPTIADILNACSVPWTIFNEGYSEKKDSNKCYPKYYDATDNPFAYFPSLTENKNGNFNFRDYEDFLKDITNKTLPMVNYVKFLGVHSEHPGFDNSFITGQLLSNEVINKVMESEYYRDNTLVILVPDESGGFYDHVTPPNKSEVDGYTYGPRTQFITVGQMVKKNYISHVELEPSSLIRFIEWNFIGKEGQLETRDKFVNNIGDLIDENIAGKIPSLNPLHGKDRLSNNKKTKKE